MRTALTRSRSASARRWLLRSAVHLLGVAVGLVVLLVAVGELLTRVVDRSGFERSDARVDRILAAHRTPAWNTATHYATLLAATSTVIAAGAALGLVLLVWRRWRESAFVAAALIGEVSVFLTVTLVVDRHRPAVRHLDVAPPTSSFPSGHTAAAVVLYGAVAVLVVRLLHAAVLRWVAVLLAVALPLTVAASRLYRGMHYPTDVTAGALLGVCWLAAVTRTLQPGKP